MSHGVARVTKDIAAGNQIGNGQDWVTVEGTPWIVLGDINAVHGIPPHVPGADAMAEGSPYVSIDNIPVCREGHCAGCGHPTTGSALVFLDD